MAAGLGVPQDGAGTTITLGTSTWEATALITSVTPDAITRNALETTYLLTTTARTFTPEDLQDNGSFSVEFLFHDTIAPPIAAAETVTITYPIITGQTTAALITGSAFCTNFTTGSATAGEVMRGSATWKWAGALTFTPST